MTDVGFDNLWGSHLQSQNELNHVSWRYYTLVIDLIGQLLIILTTFLVRTITAWTVLDGTLTVTLIPTLRPTLALLRQQLYRTSEARILLPYDICVAHKPITTLRRLLTNVKDKDKPEGRQGAVYKIKYCDCQASYIGETGRNLSTRLTEHKRTTRNRDVNIITLLSTI